jgi:predicted TIM-barrel fold metal-dependent hydrolase
MSVSDIQAIDVHAHYGRWDREGMDLTSTMMSGDAQHVIDRARLANTCLTVVSPLQALMPRFQGDPVGGNEHAAQLMPQHPELRQWVVIDPRKPDTYGQAEQMLALPGCVGIKIHPEEHGYPIKEYGRQIFEFAAKHRAIMLTHSGEVNSLPEDFVPFANDFPDVRLILAHIGCTIDRDPGHQVRAVQQSKHGNIYADTSSAQSVIGGLIEWAVGEIGSERILFGTDSPLYFAPMQRARIDHAVIADAAKERILRDNAMELFQFSEAAASSTVS